MNRKEKAMEIFKQGYNCAQAVLLAFAEELSLDEAQAIKLSAPFGGGLARTRAQCGAVSAMAMVIGLMKHQTNGDISKNNGDIYLLTQKCLQEFTARNQTIVCGDLLKNVKNLIAGTMPQERTEEYYKIRPCSKFVLDAVDIIEKYCL